MDRIEMRNKKPCAVRLREGRRHSVSKFRKAVSMKTAVEDEDATLRP